MRKDQQKYWRKSTEPKPGLSNAMRQAQVNIKFDHTNSTGMIKTYVNIRVK